jgi:hypothetical protein
MPKPWEYDWSGGGDPSALNLLPIVPFFGRQRPPMLGEDGQSAVPPPMPPAGPYAMPAIDPAAMTAAGPFVAAVADPSAMPGAGAAPALPPDAFAAPAAAPPQPFPMDAFAQQAPLSSEGAGRDHFAQARQPVPFQAPSMPGMLPDFAGGPGQPRLQPAAYDSWAGAAGEGGTSANPSQADAASANLMLARGRAILPNGVPDMFPRDMLMHGSAPGTSARRAAAPVVQPKNRAPTDVRSAGPLQKEQLHLVPELHFSPPGAVNPAVWFDRLERVGERSRPGQVSHAGARGPMQVTLMGAKQAAKILGIKLDIDKWKNDPDYGRMLGQADAASLLQRYGGDVVLATAAYNYGAYNLDKMMKRIGDPRRGEISYEQFTQNIPVKETRQYVKRVVYDNYTEERPQPKEFGSGRRLSPPLRLQKERRSAG